MSGIQVVGNVNNSTPAEVEANTKALRTVIRPDDWGTLGIYHIGANNGASAMAAGLTAASPVFSFRWGSSNVGIIKRVILDVVGTATAFTAGEGIFNLFAARSFTVSDSGGTSVLPASNSNKLRTSMGTTLVTDMYVSPIARLSGK